MRDSDQKYYLCKSGEVKRRAEEYRATYLRLKAKLWEILESFGAEEASICPTMMLIQGIAFKGEPPAGWSKKKHGVSRPKPGTIAPELRRFFQPNSCWIELHKDLAPFRDWLACPFHYTYTMKPGNPLKITSGSGHLGRLFSDGFVFWYDPAGPIMLELPDVAGAKKRADERGEIVDNHALDWTPPKGLKETLSEEWDLMAAKHKLATGQITKETK